MSRKVCVVTGTRADYGLMKEVLHRLNQESSIILQIVATGMHLSPEFGLTYKALEKDGFKIDEKVEMLLSSDSTVGIAKSIGLGVIGFADAFSRLQPDLSLLFGDRFEILAAAQAAMVARIPIAHVFGGDTTEGAMDEAIRHSITKMSHLHFVSNAPAGKRVAQMGENPANIYVVGSPALDVVHNFTPSTQGEIEQHLNFKFRKRNVLVTFHPVTLENQSAGEQIRELLAAIEAFGDDLGVIFTATNSDTDGRIINQLMQEFAVMHGNTVFVTSLGQQLYLSTLGLVDAVVGNSSSGLYEAPSFHLPTVNIGDRQRGRLQAASVINCNPQKDCIINAMNNALNMDCTGVVNPYGDGRSAERIVQILVEISDYNSLLKKHFHDL